MVLNWWARHQSFPLRLRYFFRFEFSGILCQRWGTVLSTFCSRASIITSERDRRSKLFISMGSKDPLWILSITAIYKKRKKALFISEFEARKASLRASASVFLIPCIVASFSGVTPSWWTRSQAKSVARNGKGSFCWSHPRSGWVHNSAACGWWWASESRAAIYDSGICVSQKIYSRLLVLVTITGLDRVLREVSLLFLRSMGWKPSTWNEAIANRLLIVANSRSEDQCKPLIAVREKILYSCT